MCVCGGGGGGCGLHTFKLQCKQQGKGFADCKSLELNVYTHKNASLQQAQAGHLMLPNVWYCSERFARSITVDS